MPLYVTVYGVFVVSVFVATLPAVASPLYGVTEIEYVLVFVNPVILIGLEGDEIVCGYVEIELPKYVTSI